jgi:hypothetical protein
MHWIIPIGLNELLQESLRSFKAVPKLSLKMWLRNVLGKGVVRSSVVVFTLASSPISAHSNLLN